MPITKEDILRKISVYKKSLINDAIMAGGPDGITKTLAEHQYKFHHAYYETLLRISNNTATIEKFEKCENLAQDLTTFVGDNEFDTAFKYLFGQKMNKASDFMRDLKRKRSLHNEIPGHINEYLTTYPKYLTPVISQMSSLDGLQKEEVIKRLFGLISQLNQLILENPARHNDSYLVSLRSSFLALK